MKNIVNIIKIAKPLYHLVIALAILIVLTAFLELLTPIFSKFIVDEIVARVEGKGGSVEQLIFLVVVAFIVSLLGLILTVITNRLGDHFAGRMRKFLTEKYYEKVLTLPQSYFDSEMSGKVVNQLNRGITTIQASINTATNFILPTIMQSIFTIIVLAYYSLPIAIFTFLLFPIYLVISYYSTKKWGEEEVKKNKLEDYSRGRIQEVISNISLVKSFNNENQEYNYIEKTLGKVNQIYSKQSRTFHLFDLFRGFSLIVILLCINLLAFYNAFEGIITIGILVLILQLVNQARRPLFAMSFILTQIQTAESGSKEFFEVMQLTSKEEFGSEIKTEKLKDPKITFHNVNFKYEESDTILKSINFSLKDHEKVALVGHSGAGKSTIVNLILKFYDPESGEISLNDKAYSNLHHKFIRHNISLVFQESELFSSTIKENVSYGSIATEEQIINALKLANAWNFVQKLPKGLESEVGERGVRLSGGQKQRIQIARAILKDSPILILDEATSSLDAKSEKEVQVALEHLMENKLVIIIAHRFSTIQNVDRILVINEGEIVDSGDPRELARKPGIYSDLLNYQIEGNKKLLEKFEIY